MHSSNPRPVKSFGFPGFRERSNVTTAVRSRSNVVSASPSFDAVKTSYSASRHERICSRMFSSSSTTRTFAFTDVSSFPCFPQSLVAQYLLDNFLQLKTARGFNDFQNDKKDSPLERRGKFLKQDSKYNATTLSFFSRKAKQWSD